MAKKVVVVLADGCEEIEAVSPIDVLRRAGLDVTVAGLESENVTGDHGIRFTADTSLKKLKELPEAIVLPGGHKGAENLHASKTLSDILLKMHAEKRPIMAICASPGLVLAPLGILDGKKATCYPGYEKNFSSKVKFVEDRVVVDGHVVTSRGPGSALEFALEVARQLGEKEAAAKLTQGMLVKA